LENEKAAEQAHIIEKERLRAELHAQHLQRLADEEALEIAAGERFEAEEKHRK